MRVDRRNRGNQVGDAEGSGNRAGDETVGGGDDGTQVAVVAVLFDDILGFRTHDRQDVAFHVFLMPGIEFGPRVTG